MAQAVRQERITPADELRSLLTQSEKLVGSLYGSGAGALRLLQNMDRISELWPELEALGVDLRPEAGRWSTLQANVHKQAARIVAELRSSGGLASARARRFPGRDAPWWWRLDEQVRQRRLARLRSAAIATAGVIVVLFLVRFLLNWLYPTDPTVAASTSRQLDGQQMVQNGNFQAALADFQEAASLTPDNPEPWIWLGVTQEKLALSTEAKASYANAQRTAGSQLNFYLQRGPVYLQLEMIDQSQADLQAALKLDPNNAQAYYFMAGVYEARQQFKEAVDALQKASELADANDEPQVTAMARYRMAMLLQAMQAQGLSGGTPEGTPEGTPAAK